MANPLELEIAAAWRKFCDDTPTTERLKQVADGAYYRIAEKAFASGYVAGCGETMRQVETGELPPPCQHPNYRTKPHPDGGEQPWCPTCREFVQL